MPVEFAPPPTWANPILEEVDPATGQKKSTFNPAWLKWFVDLTSVITGGGGGTGTLGDTRGAPGASGLDGHLVAFDGDTGLAIKDGGPPIIFVDAEVLTGTVDGFNDTFFVADEPSPPESLFLFHKTGRLIYIRNVDYTLFAAGQIVFAAPPAIGDVIYANYRRF